MALPGPRLPALKRRMPLAVLSALAAVLEEAVKRRQMLDGAEAQQLGRLAAAAQRLVRIRSTGTGLARSRAPIRRAWSRPVSLRFRWVAQSSWLKSGGSLVPGTMRVWRAADPAPQRDRHRSAIRPRPVRPGHRDAEVVHDTVGQRIDPAVQGHLLPARPCLLDEAASDSSAKGRYGVCHNRRRVKITGSAPAVSTTISPGSGNTFLTAESDQYARRVSWEPVHLLTVARIDRKTCQLVFDHRGSVRSGSPPKTTRPVRSWCPSHGVSAITSRYPCALGLANADPSAHLCAQNGGSAQSGCRPASWNSSGSWWSCGPGTAVASLDPAWAGQNLSHLAMIVYCSLVLSPVTKNTVLINLNLPSIYSEANMSSIDPLS